MPRAMCLCFYRKYLNSEVVNCFVRSKSLSSKEWLDRRLRDPYVEKAKLENYRCRSAFKLLEIDKKFKIIKPGQLVVDIGAAPGSWSQVLVSKTNAKGEDENKPKGMVISVDRSPIYKLDGAHTLSGMDFTKEYTQKKIMGFLDGKKLDFVFSDMAPNASGVKALDIDSIHSLALSVLAFAVQNLRTNGGCLIKMWEGRHHEIANEIRKFFIKMNFVKPSSTQKESSEVFLLGRDFKGILPKS